MATRLKVNSVEELYRLINCMLFSGRLAPHGEVQTQQVDVATPFGVVDAEIETDTTKGSMVISVRGSGRGTTMDLYGASTELREEMILAVCRSLLKEWAAVFATSSTPALLLNTEQARAAYDAMCATNNVGGHGVLQFGWPSSLLTLTFAESVKVTYRENASLSVKVREDYSSQSAFAQAYGLEGS